MNLKSMSREDLEALFRERREALLEVRDELDRRDRDAGHAVDFDFCQYVTD